MRGLNEWWQLKVSSTKRFLLTAYRARDAFSLGREEQYILAWVMTS